MTLPRLPSDTEAEVAKGQKTQEARSAAFREKGNLGRIFYEYANYESGLNPKFLRSKYYEFQYVEMQDIAARLVFFCVISLPPP
jgi:hypothetical protein